MDDELQRIREKKLEELRKGLTRKDAPAPGPKAGGTVMALGEREFPRALREYPFLVVDMWAPWCGPCKMVAPVVQELAAEFAGKIAFAKVNTDESRQVAMTYGITAIPTILFFAQGQLVDKVIGAYPKPMLRDRILRVFGMTG